MYLRNLLLLHPQSNNTQCFSDLSLHFPSLKVCCLDGHEAVLDQLGQQWKWYLLSSIKVCLARLTYFIVGWHLLWFLVLGVAQLSGLNTNYTEHQWWWQTDRQKQRNKDRQRHRHKNRQRQRQNKWKRENQTERDRDRDRDKGTERRDRDKDRQAEWQRQTRQRETI